MRKYGLLIALFICISSLFGIISCTYDYFEDDTNYQVFVPEVLNNSITDCRVMVYTEDGVLVRERYAASPWGKDLREQAGLFSFSLAPGKYQVYCYTNTDSITFTDVKTLETAAFYLNERNTEVNSYVQPSDILFQKLTPQIVHTGALKIDTTAITKYTGRITVRFKNFPADASLVSHVSLKAKGAAVQQSLKGVTETAHRSGSDIMYHRGELPVQLQDPVTEYLEVEHLYFPTVDDGSVVELEYTFIDSSGNNLIRIPVFVADKNTGLPLRLYSDDRLIIDIDAYTIISMTIVGWDEDIQSGGTNLE